MEMKYGKLKLSVQGTNNGSGFDIIYDFGENFDFVEGVSKKEFLFIQPWMQFPNQKYTDACKLASIELVRRFNEFPQLELLVERWKKDIEGLVKQRDELRDRLAINEHARVKE